ESVHCTPTTVVTSEAILTMVNNAKDNMFTGSSSCAIATTLNSMTRHIRICITNVMTYPPLVSHGYIRIPYKQMNVRIVRCPCIVSTLLILIHTLDTLIYQPL